MTDDYEKLPYIGKKRAKRLRDKGIGIEEIANMDEQELKKHLPRISKGKIKIIIATARKIAGQMNDISLALGLDKEKAKILAFNNYDLQKVAKANKEELAKLLNISEKEAFDIIFKAALKTGVQKPKIKIKKEEINHSGIISKEGFINGFGSTQLFPSKEKSFRILPILIILLVIVSSIAAIVYFMTPTLKIDGNFSEWTSVPGYSMGNITYKYTYKAGSLYFYIHRDDIFSTEQSYYLYIGNGSDYGYYVEGIHAQYMAEFYGWNGTLKGASLWKYVSGDILWNFTHTSGMNYAWGENGIEFLINEINPNSKVVLIANSGVTLRSPSLNVNSYPAQVIVRNVRDIAVNNKPVLEISVNSPTNFQLDALEISCAGAGITSARLRIGNNSVIGSVFNDTVEFDLNTKMKNEKMYFIANYTGSSGSVFSFNVTLYSKDIKFTYVYEMAKLYLFSAPTEVRIDGAFGDWKEKIPDSILDVRDSNIDLVNYSYTPDISKVYMEVRGEFMGGSDVPIVHKWAPKDSDRDGVPDNVDPYPHDFNNDGIPDSESNHDVDGDGYTDYPYGNDTWLNTTIPSDFPAPYAGRHVSVYIGPPPPVKPKNGNDTAEIYINDGSSTGEHLYWVPFDVNYKISITGRDGIFNATLYKFSTGGWQEIGTINDIAAGYHQVELDTMLNITSNGKIWITVFNWEHNYDMPSINLKKATKSYVTDTFYLHGSYHGYNFRNMNWTEGDNDLSDELTDYTGDTVNWYYEEPITGKFNVSSASLTIWYEDEDGITGINRLKKYLNVSLYEYNLSTDNSRLLGYSGEYEITQGDTDEHTVTIDIPVGANVYISKGNYLKLSITYTAGSWSTGIYIYYNSTSHPSRLEVTTNSTLRVMQVWTANDTTRDLQTHFHKDETVGIYTNVTDPLGVAHIADATTVDIVDQLGNTIISGSQMTWESDGFGWVHFYFSFPLVGNPYTFVGKYSISIQASDVEGFSTSGNGAFWVNSGVKQAASKYLFVPAGESHIWFRHRIKNIGDGDDVYNFRFNPNEAPKFDVRIYLDVNENKIIDASDILYAIYNATQGAWTYIKNDTDGNGEPDITVPEGDKPRILISTNVTLSESNPITYVNLTVASFTGNSSYTVHDFAKIRDVKNKTLYLREDGNTEYLYPKEGSTDVSYFSNKDTVVWTQSNAFLNDLLIVGNITVVLYVEKGEGQADYGYVELSLDDGTSVGSVKFDMPSPSVPTEVRAVIKPTINIIPAGHTLSLTFYSTDTDNNPRKWYMYYNSTTYNSRIIFNTTSYIYVENIQLYNVTSGTPVLQSNYSTGDNMNITAVVRETFGSFDVKSVTANITAPNGTTYPINLNLVEVHPLIGTLVYNGTFNIPSNALVGIYNVNVTAIEGNGVQNNSYTTFNINCNISITPHTNSSTGTVVWYNHTIWNNGKGYDIIDISVVSNETVNVTLYIWDGSTWKVAAYSNTGTGWSWVDTTNYDSDGDGNPDVTIAPGNSAKIMVKVTATQNVSTDVEINSFAGCSDSAVDETTVPELNQMLEVLLFLPLIVIYFRRKKK